MNGSCRLEGDFIRDWIVDHYMNRSTTAGTNTNTWIEYKETISTINKEVVPYNFDCHLLAMFIISINRNSKINLDENELINAFTIDLIESHIVLAYDRIDSDVNNLTVEKDYTHKLGMRINITKKPYLIELESIIENIQKNIV
ncbi:unnamed protein product, partial [Adineta ricciae]